MIPKLNALALTIFTPAAMAQMVANTTADLSKTALVASPNRTLAQDMGQRKTDHLLTPDRRREALRLVDVQGRVVGRLAGTDRLLMRYKNELLTIQLSPAATSLPFSSGGLTWAVSGAIYYQSADCSGPGFLPPAFTGTNFIGVGLTEGGKNIVLVGDVRQAVTIQFGSAFRIGPHQCNAGPVPPATTVGIPIEAGVNVDAFAVPPFLIE